jgi:thiamine biosynthesis lipoprotein
MLRLIFLLVFPASISAQLNRFEFSENKMGSPFRIIFYHSDSLKAVSLPQKCYLLVDSLNNIFSDYTLTSEVGKLSQLKPFQEQRISDELFSMIMYSKKLWTASHKTFDITIGALTHLWRKARSENRFPSEEEIKAANQLTGFKNLILDPAKQTIAFKKSGMQLDFGGIVKGYAAQRVIEFLRMHRTPIALVDAGGDIVVSDPPPFKEGWSIAMNIPESEFELWNKKLQLKHCAAATSGDVYRFIIHEGKKYSHIIDPKTGYGLTSQKNVTVITKYGADADWLATACSILPVRRALRLAKEQHAALFIAYFKKEKLVIRKTKGFDRYFEKKQP